MQGKTKKKMRRIAWEQDDGSGRLSDGNEDDGDGNDY